MNFDLSREWLETNGIGGSASSTIIGVNTRRYHALLSAATVAPQERMVLVSKADESLSVGFRQFDLGANMWPGAIHPNGYLYLQEFHLDPLPRWVWEIPTSEGQIRFQKTLWMPHGSNTTVVEYLLLEGPECTLRTHAYVTGRDYHSSHHYNQDFNDRAESSPGVVAMKPYENTPWVIFSHDGEFYSGGTWYQDFQWEIEAERGLDASEDAFSPGAFVWKLRVGQPALLVVSTSPQGLQAMQESKATEIERRAQLALGATAGDSREGAPTAAADDELWHRPQNRLRLAADQFIVQREDGLHTVLAGYPWFTDWGRDTMIALPGLCLSTGRYDVAASILRSFAGSMSKGMIPNRFPDGGQSPDYNTVDATLWFFHAVERYAAASGDWETVQELYPHLVESIDWHLAGTRYGIKADEEDGLLAAGNDSSQLTWMDAKVGDTAFTPRNGKPVEIQALWYNALRFMVEASRKCGNESMAGICKEWSRKVSASFADLFWNAEEGCLYDYISGDSVLGYTFDGAVRPNQVIALALPHRLLNRDQEVSVLATVAADLLTPVGLRSLSPRDSRYRGIYKGNQWARDSAYHQGTVWTWPMGSFLSAYLRVNEYTEEARQQVREWLAPLMQHLDEACLNSVSEIFDGDAPFMARGCCAQAWSVSEILRVLVELEAPAPPNL